MNDEKMSESFEAWFKNKGGKLDIPAAPLPDLIKAIAWEGWQAAQRQRGEAVAWMDGISGNVTTNPDPEHLTDTDLYIPLYAEPPHPAVPELTVQKCESAIREGAEKKGGSEPGVLEAQRLVRSILKRTEPPEDAT